MRTQMTTKNNIGSYLIYMCLVNKDNDGGKEMKTVIPYNCICDNKLCLNILQRGHKNTYFKKELMKRIPSVLTKMN